MNGGAMVEVLRALGRRVAERLPRANEGLLALGVGLVAVAVVGGGLSVGGVAVAGLDSWWRRLVLIVAGCVLLGLGVMVGEPSEGLDGGRPQKGPGRFIGARPPLPARFVPRPDMVDNIVERLLADTDRPLALVGMGGAGKTVLAVAAASDPRVQRRFREGVAWLEVNQRPDPVALLSRLAARLGVPDLRATDLDLVRDVVADRLAGRRVLVVLDNVWDRIVLDAFTGLGARVLVSSRHVDVARAAGADRVEVAQLSLDQALALLARWSGREVAELPPVADRICLRVDRLALGVAMIGAMLAQPGRRWRDILQLLDTMDLAQIKADFGHEYPHPNLLAAIQLSIDDLPDQPTRQCYRELAVFAGCGAFPQSAVEALWQPVGLDDATTGELLGTLADRSLLTIEADGWFAVHDLQHDVTRHQLGTKRLAQAHRRLLRGYQTRCPQGWATGPDDGHYYQHLTSHLADAGRRGELTRLLADTRWMLARLERQGIVELVADYAADVQSPASRAIRAALSVSGQTVSKDPSQLPGHLVGRLLGNPDPAVAAAVEAIRESWDGCAWLCPLEPGALSPAHGPQRRIFRVSDYGLQAAAFSADGTVMVAADLCRIAHVWDLTTGRRTRSLEGHTGDINAVAMTPDGELAITVSGNRSDRGSMTRDNTVRVWNVASGRLVRTLQGHLRVINAVAVDADGARIASAGDDRSVRVWDLASGRLVHTLIGHRQAVRVVAVSPDGKLAVSAGGVEWPNRSRKRDLTVRVWDLTTGWPVHQLDAHTEMVTALAVSPDSRQPVTGSDDRTLRVWDLTSGEPIKTLHGHRNRINTVAFTPDGRRIIVAGDGAQMLVWDVMTGHLVGTLTGHVGSVHALGVDRRGKHLLSADDTSMRLWDLTSVEVPKDAAPADADPEPSLVSSRDSTDEGVDRLVRTLPGAGGAIRCVALAPGGLHAAAGTTNHQVVVWDVASSRPLRYLSHNGPWATTVAFSPDGRYVLAGGDDGVVNIWPLATGQLGHTMRSGVSIRFLAGSQDNRHVVSIDRDGVIHLLDATTGTRLAWFVADRPPQRVRFAHDDPVTIAVDDTYSLQLQE